MATRWGGGRARLWKSQARAAERPLLTFPGLWVPQAEWESALSQAAVQNRVRGLGARPACGVRADGAEVAGFREPRDDATLT